MANKTKEELQATVMDSLPDQSVTMGFMEHQIDLIAKVVSIMANKHLDVLSDEEKVLVEHLDGLLKYTSVDFNNLEDPLQSYKIPKATEAKKRTRLIQDKYLQAQLREGIFGK